MAAITSPSLLNRRGDGTENIQAVIVIQLSARLAQEFFGCFTTGGFRSQQREIGVRRQVRVPPLTEQQTGKPGITPCYQGLQ